MSLFKDPNKLPPRIVLNKGADCSCCGKPGIRMLRSVRAITMTGSTWTWALCINCDGAGGFATPPAAG